MTTEELKTKIFGKTETGGRYTFRQWLIHVWFALALCMLGVTEDAPLWFCGVLLANSAAAAYNLQKLPLPADIEDDKREDDDEEA